MGEIQRVSRREFLRRTGLAGGGLVLGLSIASWPGDDARGAEAFQPNVFVAVGEDGRVRIWVSRSEMGQGTRTGMPMILAEELEVALDDVEVVQADGDEKYGHQLTGGSLSVRLMWDPLRRAGATARELLIQAAAEQAQVESSECVAREGRVLHEAGGRAWGYGELVARAAELPLPDEESVPLKSASEYRLLGQRAGRVDTPDIITGRARYGMDTRRPGLRYVAVARCPIYGGRRREFDPAPAMAIDGVERVLGFDGLHGGFYLADGVAVVARDTWSALEAAEALEMDWQTGENADASTDDLRRRFGELAGETGEIVRDDGDVEAALRSAETVLEATYELPYLAHAPMEPMNCTIDLRSNRCEVWTPTQNPQSVRENVARVLELDVSAVTVHVTLVGGGFGRRLYPDMEMEAAIIAREVDGPIMVVWNRAEDMQHDRYRPSSHHVLRGALDADGLPSAWHWRILNTHTGRFDSEDFPAYQIPNYRAEYMHVPWILPRGAWRSTVHSQNPFVTQSFLDEMAHAAGRDPVELTLQLLRERPRPDGGGDPPFEGNRLLRVLEEAADRADWGRAVEEGHGRGIGFQYCYDSYVAEVVDLHATDDGAKVDRVTAVVDCGQVVNPDLVEAQFEGGVVFTLSATMLEEITVDGGRVQQSNFHDFRMLRGSQAPEVTTHILASDRRPGGIGEAPVPPTMPAVANAYFAATGTRVRKLPMFG